MTKANNSKTLFVTDLDGTLLGSDSRISAKSAQILTDLVSSGIKITAATARTPATVDGLLRGSGLRLPVIVMTGAALWDPVKRNYISYRAIETDVAGEIRQLMTTFGLRPFVYRLDSRGILHTYHNGPMTKAEKAFAAERSRLPLKRLHLDHPDGELNVTGTVLFFAIGTRENVYACAESLRLLGSCSVSAYNDIFNPDSAYIEVMAEGVSKATAVTELAKKLKVKSVTVFGDNLNDIPMMQIADHAVAVANAQEEVKNIADETIGSNFEDAVPLYIKKVTGF